MASSTHQRSLICKQLLEAIDTLSESDVYSLEPFSSMFVQYFFSIL